MTSRMGSPVVINADGCGESQTQAYRGGEGACLKGACKKIRVPRWCWVHSSRPVARVRPLLDLLLQLPLRGAACDLRSGSGLTANRTNLPNASELYPAFDWVSRSARPALCYRPLLAFPPHFAMLRVTQLEPRTAHQ